MFVGNLYTFFGEMSFNAVGFFLFVLVLVFVCFLVFIVQVLASFIKFIPKSLVLFGVSVNRILFLISFSDCSLLVYRETIEFCILNLYAATLLNSLISFNSLLMGSSGFVHTRSCHLQIEIVFVLPFQSGCLLFIFLA